MIKFFFFFFCFALLFFYLTKDYVNPYKLIMIFGKKGSGKSTLLNRMCMEHHKKGWTIYASESMPFANIFDPKKMGEVSFPPHSLIIIDEVSLLWDNRSFKEFPKAFGDWLRLQRHYQCKLIIASQTFDCDKKLRDQADALYLCQSKFRVFTWAKRINRKITLTDAAMDGKGESRIVDNLVFDSLLEWPFGSRILTFIPRYSHLFDTHKVYKELPLVQCSGFVASDDLEPLWVFWRKGFKWIVRSLWHLAPVRLRYYKYLLFTVITRSRFGLVCRRARFIFGTVLSRFRRVVHSVKLPRLAVRKNKAGNARVTN